MSAESIAVQIAVLTDTICPQLDDPAGCATGVEAHWNDIGSAMYPVFFEGESVCVKLGACKVRATFLTSKQDQIFCFIIQD